MGFEPNRLTSVLDPYRSTKNPCRSERRADQSDQNFHLNQQQRLGCHMRDDAGIFPPHTKEAIFVDIVDEALVRRCVHLEYFTYKLLDCRSLQEHHRRIVATKIDRSPVSAHRLQIYGPEVSTSV